VVADLTGHLSGNEFYNLEAPPEIDGKTFDEALVGLRRSIGALLVAVGGADGYEVNPADRVIRAGERLLVIAESDPQALFEA
jgi:Trk K+ transport system NAD-binding subunit